MDRWHTIGFAVDGALIETHDVLSESSCFVWEDVLDLPQLFIECSGTGLSRCVLWWIIHFAVPVNVETVTQAYDLYTGETERESDGILISLRDTIFSMTTNNCD